LFSLEIWTSNSLSLIFRWQQSKRTPTSASLKRSLQQLGLNKNSEDRSNSEQQQIMFTWSCIRCFVFILCVHIKPTISKYFFLSFNFLFSILISYLIKYLNSLLLKINR
jgi:hypothetical protein